MTIRHFIITESHFLLLIAFPIFASATIGFLLIVDTLECILHCVRLHWVEFQNKFYHGQGYHFEPLDFKQVLGLHS